MVNEKLKRRVSRLQMERGKNFNHVVPPVFFYISRGAFKKLRRKHFGIFWLVSFGIFFGGFNRDTPIFGSIKLLFLFA
jgi:hypothetical protein